MARTDRTLIFFATTAILVSCNNTKPAATYTGQVTKVHDGDSIHITPPGQKRVIIRLAGIDAPELKQPFGIQSRDNLRSMILDRQATAECHKVDRYQRQVCVVLFNRRDVNLAMVEGGFAWHYKQYQNEQTEKQRQQYSKAESRAQSDQLGLWDGESIEPWVFRKLN